MSAVSNPPQVLSFPALDRLDRAAFVAALDQVFEHSPWVAEESWERRPFGNLATLHRVMIEVVGSATPDKQLSLIRAHPELAGAAALKGALTQASLEEQSSAGLAAANPSEVSLFRQLNDEYRRKFGFPFVMAVAGRSKAEIFAAFAERLTHSPEQELERALQEIARIAYLRLEKLIAASAS
jgi:2-oxo-4-hydroxy-4-carboxy-5-ureidoimidazoline decarboxylase